MQIEMTITCGDILQAIATIIVGFSAWRYTYTQTLIARDEVNIERFKESFQAYKACLNSLDTWKQEYREYIKGSECIRSFVSVPLYVCYSFEDLSYWLPADKLRLKQILLEANSSISEKTSSLPTCYTDRFGKEIEVEEPILFCDDFDTVYMVIKDLRRKLRDLAKPRLLSLQKHAT